MEGPRSDIVCSGAEKMKLEFADLEISGEQRLDLAIFPVRFCTRPPPN